MIALLLAAAAATGVQAEPYGTLADGRPVEQYTLRNARGMTVRFIGYGGIITEISVPDRRGNAANVALGYAKLADYETKNGSGFGAAVGRYAGRIAGARFAIDGREVRLQPNDGPNALHGGGGANFSQRLWSVQPFEDREGPGAVLSYTSPAGEQGFPGTLTVRMTYRLLPSNALRIDYEATTDAPTVLNLTNHSYFNLAGAGSGNVYGHSLQVFSRRYLLTNEGGIPSAPASVRGTPFDFSKPRPIGADINSDHPQMTGRRGYNHSWLLDNGGRLRRAARLADPGSGRVMEVLTTEPSVHVYTANWFSGEEIGAQGTSYRQHDGVALETQHLPDSPNRPDFPTTLLRPGETFRSTTVYRFTAG